MVLLVRLGEGAEALETVDITGGAPEQRLAPTALDRLSDAGFIENDSAGLRATAAGRMRLNSILAALL